MISFWWQSQLIQWNVFNFYFPVPSWTTLVCCRSQQEWNRGWGRYRGSGKWTIWWEQLPPRKPITPSHPWRASPDKGPVHPQSLPLGKVSFPLTPDSQVNVNYNEQGSASLTLLMKLVDSKNGVKEIVFPVSQFSKYRAFPMQRIQKWICCFFSWSSYQMKKMENCINLHRAFLQKFPFFIFGWYLYQLKTY